MNNLELIDRLCDITSEQAKLIKMQAEIIEQSHIIELLTKQELKETESSIDDELDLIECACRRL